MAPPLLPPFDADVAPVFQQVHQPDDIAFGLADLFGDLTATQPSDSALLLVEKLDERQRQQCGARG
jgi:hypothetical protein